MNRQKNIELFRAAEDGDVEAVRRLVLQEGASVHGTGIDNWTALHFAARKGHKIVVDLLICLGADVNAVTRVCV